MLFRSIQPAKDLNVRPDSIKLLEENIGRTLYDINHSKILFDPAPREMEIKTKINKWDLMKLKSFCTAKETINKTKHNPQNRRKHLQTKQMIRDLSLKYINSSCSSISKKPNHPIKKWAEDLNRHFSKKTYRWPTNT